MVPNHRGFGAAYFMTKPYKTNMGVVVELFFIN
jgi:hypothetical protein